MTAEADLIASLVRAFPELSIVLDGHVEVQDGELLPYLFMGDVARWLHARGSTDPQRAQAVLAWLETAFVKGDFDERNLIDVGVVEMLPASPQGDPVLELLGPELRARAEISGLVLPRHSEADTMENLRQLMAAYFHQDWFDEYGGSWEAGVADFARRAPERVPGTIAEVNALLSRSPTDVEVERLLGEVGNYRNPGDSPTAHLDWLRAIRAQLTQTSRHER